MYVLNWKSKGVFRSILSSLHTAFLQSIKLLEYKMRIKFHKESIVEQNNYATKAVNAYIVYELATLAKIPLHNFTLKLII